MIILKIFNRYVFRNWKTIPMNLMALIPKGYRNKLACRNLHAKVRWVLVQGSTSPSETGNECVLVESSSGDKNQGCTVVQSQERGANKPTETTCLKPKHAEDERFLIEMYTSDLCSEVFFTNLENANKGLLHVELCRNALNFHFGPENNLDPVFPSLRLNSSNKNTVPLKRLCRYSNPNSYVDRRINLHMKKVVGDNSRSLPANDELASMFAEEIFTQLKDPHTKRDAATPLRDPLSICDVMPRQDVPPIRDATPSQNPSPVSLATPQDVPAPPVRVATPSHDDRLERVATPPPEKISASQRQEDTAHFPERESNVSGDFSIYHLGLKILLLLYYINQSCVQGQL